MKDLIWLSLTLKERENQAFLKFFFFLGEAILQMRNINTNKRNVQILRGLT